MQTQDNDLIVEGSHDVGNKGEKSSKKRKVVKPPNILSNSEELLSTGPKKVKIQRSMKIDSSNISKKELIAINRIETFSKEKENVQDQDTENKEDSMVSETEPEALREKPSSSLKEPELTVILQNEPSKSTPLKQAPVSTVSFEDIAEIDKSSADKSLFIKEIMENGYKVETILRPRRFGKTLNLSMLDLYLSILHKDSYEKNFKIKKIYEDKNFYESHGNKYPVIYLDFSNFSTPYKPDDTWPTSSFHSLIKEILKSYYDTLEASPHLNQVERKQLNDLIEKPSESLIGIKTLSDLLKKHYKQPAIVLIDEYDKPINNCLQDQEKLRALNTEYANFLNSALKGNRSYKKCVLTGMARVAQNGLLSELNNSVIHTLLTSDYHQYYGFDSSEVIKIISEVSGLDPRSITHEQLIDVKKYYNGYKSKDLREFYNPFSIVSYANNMELAPYWECKSSNKLLKHSYKSLIEVDLVYLRSLIDGKCIKKKLKDTVSLDEVEGADQFWILLLFSGYLTLAHTRPEEIREGEEFPFRLPNEEAKICLRAVEEEVNFIRISDLNGLKNAFKDNNMNQFVKIFNTVLQSTQKDQLINGRTLSGELGYHNLLCWNLRNYLKPAWTIISEGYVQDDKGYFDIYVIPNKDSLLQNSTAYVLEIKFLPQTEMQKKKRTLEDALTQIHKKGYVRYLEQNKSYNYVKYVQRVAIVGCALQLEQKTGVKSPINNKQKS